MLIMASSSVDDLRLEIEYMRKQYRLKCEGEKLKKSQTVCQDDEKNVQKGKISKAVLSKKRGR